jgi:hypothetical protein
VGIFISISVIAQETLSVNGSVLSLERKANRWTKPELRSFDLRQVDNVCLTHIGRGFPPVVEFNYHSTTFRMAKGLKMSDVKEVVELIKSASDTQKKVAVS